MRASGIFLEPTDHHSGCSPPRRGVGRLWIDGEEIGVMVLNYAKKKEVWGEGSVELVRVIGEL